jgi:hypothetical protein
MAMVGYVAERRDRVRQLLDSKVIHILPLVICLRLLMIAPHFIYRNRSPVPPAATPQITQVAAATIAFAGGAVQKVKSVIVTMTEIAALLFVAVPVRCS